MRDRFLWIGTTIYAALFLLLGYVKYAAHRNLVDFGIFAQTIASAFGCFCNPIEGSHWAFHFSPILYAMALPVTIVRSPLMLIAEQAIAGALCAAPVYAIVRKRSDRITARFAAVVVWLYPPLAAVTFGDFHENSFAPAAVAWTVYAFDAGYIGLTAVFAAVVLSIKEDQAIFLGIASLATAFAYRGGRNRRTLAIGVALACVVVAVAFFAFVQPHATAAPGWQPNRFYAWTAGDVRTTLTAGLGARLWFLLAIFAPLAFLPFRSRAMWLSVAPLAEVLLSRMSTTYTVGTHYAGAWMGYTFAAFALAVGDAGARARRALWWACALAALELIVADPLHPGSNVRTRQSRDVALDAALGNLPPFASVATQEEAYGHLALDDPLARLLPERSDENVDACFVLIDRDFPDSARLQEYAAHFEILVRGHVYASVLRNGGIELYRRVSGCR